MSWHDPIIPIAVEEKKSKGRWDAAVQDFRREIVWTLSASDFDRIREGYACLNCLQVHDAPFPSQCSLCGYAIEEKQRKDIEWQHEGYKHIGPSTTLKEELDRLDDEAERMRWRKGSIYVPEWANV